MRCWYRSGLLLCVCLLAVSCGGKKNEEKTAKVSGTVQLDDKPMESGDITFVGDPGTIPDVLDVKAGAFEGQVKLGQKKVEIRAYKTEKAPKSATGGATESKTNYLPEQFNTKSALKAEVTESGVEPKKFVVGSK
jgi:hypothetical protein